MNKPLLKEHIEQYKAKLKSDPEKYAKDLYERTERAAYYQSWTADRLTKMTAEELYEYLTRLWAMLIGATRSMWLIRSLPITDSML